MALSGLQEGKSDIDYLREEEFVNGLKISSADHMPATLYQVSIKVRSRHGSRLRLPAD
jgi:hypothetical protein